MAHPPSPLLLLAIAALAGATWQLARVAVPGAPYIPARRRDSRPALAAALVLFLPTVWCAAPGTILAMAAGTMLVSTILQHRHVTMLGWFAIALACAPQAAGLAPFILALMIRRRLTWPFWPGALSAVIAGLCLTPFATAESTAAIPNLWPIAAPLVDTPLTGLALAILAGALACYIASLTTAPLDRRATIEAATLAPLLIASLSPIATSTLIAGTATLAIACRWPDRRSITIAALVQFAALLALIDPIAPLAAVPLLIATAALARPFWQHPANDNPLAARATA